MTPQIPLGGRVCVIPQMAAHKEESWQLIQHVTSYDEQMAYTMAEVGLGVRADMASNPWFEENQNYRTVLEDMQYAKPKAAVEIMQMDTIVFDAIQQVILMGAGPRRRRFPPRMKRTTSFCPPRNNPALPGAAASVQLSAAPSPRRRSQ